MFSKTIDSKKKYTDANGNEVIDITDSIFCEHADRGQTMSVYKVPGSMRMRPDLAAAGAYGGIEYAEMLLKYADVRNPFSLDKDDVILIPALSSIYSPVKTLETLSGSVDPDLVANYHKFIDPSKVESTSSDAPTTEITRSPVEANMAKTTNGGIRYKNGKLYFGTNDDSDNASSSEVECPANGITAGQFITRVIKNSIE